MPVDTLLVASAELLVLGMGAVFLILTLMIGCMTILSRLAPSEELALSDHTTESNIQAVIQEAINQYRKR